MLHEPQLPPGQVEGRVCQPEVSGVTSAGPAGASSLFLERTLYKLVQQGEQGLFTQQFWLPFIQYL